jgi:hypothetical protein
LNNLPACGFVEDEDLPVLKHCPHEAEKLPLAMRENIVCEDGVEAALRLNDIPEADVSEGFAELLVGELAGRVEVEPDACLQKERLLWERDESGSHFLPGNCGKIDSVYYDGAGLQLYEPQERCDKCTLTTIESQILRLNSIEGRRSNAYLPVLPQTATFWQGRMSNEMFLRTGLEVNLPDI